MSVSLDEIQNVVLLFSNPVWVGQDVQGPPDRSITALPSQIAYTDHVTDNLTVLASQYSQTPSGQIQGFLYVPELVTNDDCRQAAAQYVPKTAVRRNNLPPTNYNLIALAPWFNATCSRAYLSSARLDPLRAFMFYRPVNSTLAPAPPESEFWNIDGTLDWKTSLRFPVFALTGAAGSKMMRALSFYSGNLTEVPFGSTIMDNYDPDPLDYVRIWTALSISPDNDTPSFWILILAVLGVLVLVVATTSIAMHWTWRHRRLSLQKRVISGEVNLEAMGIKRLTVPMSHIQQFPLFTYHYAPDDEIQPATPGSPTASRSQLPTGGVTERRGSIHRKKSHTLSMSEKTDPTSVLTTAVELSYQPTCHICLTDFRNRATIIRELSCGHIYHPDCIDEFLSEISSLCPLCKSSMVPRGSCPPITNSMVRRERAVRLLRGSISSSNPGSELGSEEGRVASWARGALARLGRARKGSSTFSLPRFAHPARARRKQHEEIKDVDHDGAMEMVESPVTPAPPAKTPAPPPPKQRRSQDEEFARRRMQELAGAEIESDDGQLPVWRKVQRTVFPGFG